MELMDRIPTLTLIVFSYGITLLPLPKRQSDSGGDFVVVTGGGGGVREVGVMDMELSVLLDVLSSTQLPSISFLLLF
jgi:hypothetical protein